MFPRPSRLKSLDSELSPVFTTPPPVEPNTVLVLISVPEMMLSSNLVAVRRRAAINPAMSAMMPSTPAPMAQVGVLLTRSSKKDGSRFAGAPAVLVADLAASGALLGAAALGSTFVSGALTSGVFASGALVSGALLSATLVSGALTSGAFVMGAGGGVTDAGGVTAAGATAAGAAALGAGVEGAIAICAVLFGGSAAFPLAVSACFCRSAIA